MSDELAYAPATDLAARIRRRDLSPVELMDAVITRIEALGVPLDPNRHQAMLEVPSDAEPGTIVQEMQSGYMIKDRLLRPALVGVARVG